MSHREPFDQAAFDAFRADPKRQALVRRILAEIDPEAPAHTQTVDKWGVLRDSRYPGVTFGNEHATRYPGIILRSVASYNGRSVWGYMLTCEHCDAEAIQTITSSVSYEDAPGHFARHECNGGSNEH